MSTGPVHSPSALSPLRASLVKPTSSSQRLVGVGLSGSAQAGSGSASTSASLCTCVAKPKGDSGTLDWSLARSCEAFRDSSMDDMRRPLTAKAQSSAHGAE
eukprot:4146361-Prymnesium_polylepis.1